MLPPLSPKKRIGGRDGSPIPMRLRGCRQFGCRSVNDGRNRRISSSRYLSFVFSDAKFFGFSNCSSVVSVLINFCASVKPHSVMVLIPNGTYHFHRAIEGVNLS